MSRDANENQGPAVLAATWCLCVLTLIILSLRLVARKISKAHYWWDDYLIIAAVPVCVVGAIVTSISVLEYGLGKHVEIAGMDGAIGVLKMFVVQTYCWLTILTLTKLSILLYLWRIFNITDLRWPIYGVGTVVMLWCLATLVTASVQCIPMSALWYPGTGHCLTPRNTWLAYSIPDIITNVALIIMPLPTIWRLHMGRWQKLGVSVVFALGSLVAVISIIRLIIVVAHFNVSEDPTWVFVKLTKWSLAEFYLAPSCACLPSLGPLVRGRNRSGGYVAHSPPEAPNMAAPAVSATRARPSDMVSNLSSATKDFRSLGKEDDYNAILRDIAA